MISMLNRLTHEQKRVINKSPICVFTSRYIDLLEPESRSRTRTVGSEDVVRNSESTIGKRRNFSAR